jgi:hypothetical protein
MSTRAAYGFIIDGKEKVTYNHSEGYLDGLGLSLLNQLNGIWLEYLEENVRNVVLVKDEDEVVTDKLILNELKDYIYDIKGDQTWYSLLRSSQGNIIHYACDDPLKYMIDGKDFLYDSLYCEYAYIINFDTGMFEFYEGYNKDPNADGRYVKLPEGTKDNGFYGVKFIGETPLKAIVTASEDDIVEYVSKIKNFLGEEDVYEDENGNEMPQLKIETFPIWVYQEQLELELE